MWSESIVLAQADRQASSDRHTGVSQIMRVSSGKANRSVHAIVKCERATRLVDVVSLVRSYLWSVRRLLDPAEPAASDSSHEHRPSYSHLHPSSS